MKIEHIGIAVKDIEKSNKIFELLLGKPHYKYEEVESEQVMTSFFKCGETKIELLAATSQNSVISKFIAAKGEGVHHIAFAVDNIFQAIEEFKSKGFRVINDFAKRGADNKLIVFLHPGDASGVLVELCQDIDLIK